MRCAGFPARYATCTWASPSARSAGVGPAALPVKVIHDALSNSVYGAIGAGAAGLGRAVDAAMERSGIGEQVSLSTTQRGSFGLAVLNGLIGDRLEREGSALAQPTSARVAGQRIGLDETSVRDAFPKADPWCGGLLARADRR